MTPWTAACQASLSITISGSLLKLMSTESVMPSNHLIFCHPLLFLPSIFPSISISPSNKYLGLISLKIDWFDLLEVQGPFKSLLQHHSSKTSIHQCSAFFMVQLSHPYMTTRKTIALTILTFVGKTRSVLFNMVSRFIMGFPGHSDGKESACNMGDLGLIPGLGRSPGEGPGNSSNRFSINI